MRKQFTVKCKNGSIKHSLAGRSIKSITHLAIGGTPVPKSFVCFERPDRLMFTLNLIDAQQKITNHPLKYVVSFRGKRCNVYQVQGAKVINVSNSLHAFERWTHKAFANLSRDHLKRTGLTSAMKKMILKKARKCGVRLNKINCTKISLSTLLTFLCYPLSYKLYLKKTGYFSQRLISSSEKENSR
jgi:hypothetical protein